MKVVRLFAGLQKADGDRAAMSLTDVAYCFATECFWFNALALPKVGLRKIESNAHLANSHPSKIELR